MRPSTRNTSSPSPVSRAMVRDMGSGASLPTAFDVRTAYDFAISLASEVGEHDELPVEDRRWPGRPRPAPPPHVRPAIEHEMWTHAAALMIDRPDVTDA